MCGKLPSDWCYQNVSTRMEVEDVPGEISTRHLIECLNQVCGTGEALGIPQGCNKSSTVKRCVHLLWHHFFLSVQTFFAENPAVPRVPSKHTTSSSVL